MNIKVEKLTQEQLQEKGVFEWPVWEKEISKFDWHYDSTERCYFLKGDVVVETKEGDVKIGEGDFVTFPKGMDCVWNVIKPVKKYYSFE